MSEPKPQSMSKTALATMLGVLGAAGVIAAIAAANSSFQYNQAREAEAYRKCQITVAAEPGYDFDHCLANYGIRR